MRWLEIVSRRRSARPGPHFVRPARVRPRPPLNPVQIAPKASTKGHANMPTAPHQL
jgi:hypothetical protein